MKNKTSNVARKITALLAGVMISGQLATPGAAIQARAEGETVNYSLEQDVLAGLVGPGEFIAEGGSGTGGNVGIPTASGSITTGFDLVITSNNKYYKTVTNAVDKLVKASQVSNGRKYTEWTTICPYTNSSTKTDLTISINMSFYDLGNYRTEDELLKKAVFHISGTHRGKKVDRYVSYCNEMKNLREALQRAKAAQVQLYCKSGKALHGDYMMMVNGYMLVWSDELGRIAVRTNQKFDLPDNGNGQVRVKITNLKAVDPYATGTYNYVYDLSGKVTIVK